MRNLEFDSLAALGDSYEVAVDVYYESGDDLDEWGNEVDPEQVYVVSNLTVPAPEPLSGSDRAQSSGTEYESSHRLYLPPLESALLPGYKVQVENTEYTIVFVSDFGTHLELNLKAVVS